MKEEETGPNSEKYLVKLDMGCREMRWQMANVTQSANHVSTIIFGAHIPYHSLVCSLTTLCSSHPYVW